MMVAVVATAFATEESFVFSSMGYKNAEEITTVNSGTVTLAFDKGTHSNGTTPKYYDSGSAARMYAGNTLIISTTSNEPIISVIVNFSGSSNVFNGSPNPTVGTYSQSGTIGTWTGSTSSFTLTSPSSVRIASIVVNLGIPPAVAVPVFTPSSSNCPEAFDAEITCSTDGASIYYTTDDTPPTISSTLYSGKFEIAQTTIVRAIAVVGEDISDESIAVYTFPTVVSSIADFLAFTSDDSGTFIKFTCPLTVTYRGISSSNDNTVYMFVQDGTDAIQIYSTGDATFGADYENGSVIPAGAVGTVGFYSKAIQLASPVASTFGTDRKSVV